MRNALFSGSRRFSWNYRLLLVGYRRGVRSLDHAILTTVKVESLEFPVVLNVIIAVVLLGSLAEILIFAAGLEITPERWTT